MQRVGLPAGRLSDHLRGDVVTGIAQLVRPLSRSTRVGALLMIASATAWAMGTIASKSVLDTYHPSPITLLVTQLAASVAVLVLVARLRGHRIRPAWRIGWTGLLEPGLAYLLGLAGLAVTSAGNAAVLGSVEPVLVPLLLWMLYHHQPGHRRLVLAGCTTLGAVAVSWGGDHHGGSVTGDLLVLAGVAAAALYVVVSSRHVERHAVAPLAASQQLWALAATVLIAGAVSFTLPTTWLTTIDGLIWAAGSGILNYALPFGLYLAALRHLHVSTAAGYLSLIPVMGLAGSFLFLGEQPTGMQLLGAAVVAASLYWLARTDRPAAARCTGTSALPRPFTATTCCSSPAQVRRCRLGRYRRARAAAR